jgi:hypothetical protein
MLTKLDTVLKRNAQLPGVGEEVEVRLADAGMVAEEMKPLLSHLDCFGRDPIENMRKPPNLLASRLVGSHNFETIITPAQFLCDTHSRDVAPFLRNVRLQSPL